VVLYARDIMEGDILVVDSGITCGELARRMAEGRHGFAVVRTPDGRYAGIVTEWDMVSRLLARGLDPSSTKVDDIMTKEIVSVDAGEELSDLADFMSKKGIRRVLVTEKGEVVGVVTCRIVLANLKSYVDSVSRDLARYGLLPF